MFAGEEVGDLFRHGKCYDVFVWSTPEARNSVSSVSELLLDTPTAATCGWATWRRCRSGRRRASSIARAIRAASTSAPTSEGRDLGSVMKDVDRQLKLVKFPSAITRSCSASTRSAGSVETGCCCSGSGPRSASCSSSWLRSATSAGSARLPDLPVGARRRTARGLLQRRRDLARGRWSASSPCSGSPPQHDHAHQPLPAPRTPRGHGVRAGAGAARGDGAAVADPDDGTGHGLALVPLVVAGDVPGHEIEYPMAVVILGGSSGRRCSTCSWCRRSTCASGHAAANGAQRRSALHGGVNV
jgi:hypothetical protein